MCRVSALPGQGIPGRGGIQDPRLRSEVEDSAARILKEAEEKGLTSPQAANLILGRSGGSPPRTTPMPLSKARRWPGHREVFSKLGRAVEDGFAAGWNWRPSATASTSSTSRRRRCGRSPRRSGRGLPFQRDDVNRFGELLRKKVGLALYLTDNSGEIYFDLPLYDYIRERVDRLVLVVKGGPSLERPHAGGAEEGRAGVEVYGDRGHGDGWCGHRLGPCVGTLLDLVAQSDFIVSKGMANFETLYAREMSASVFFIFKAKCRPIQDYLHAPPESFMALMKDGSGFKVQGSGLKNS